MFSEWLLGVWSALGIFWWLISWRLVAAERPAHFEAAPENGKRELLSIFKPLPPLGLEGLRGFEVGLESFLSQLDDQSELLLGIHEEDRLQVEPFLERMRENYPRAKLRAFFRDGPDECANPKIAWQKILAEHATGELWLWSDADMVVPPGFLASCRAEFAEEASPVLTFPYVVREVHSSAALLDALYVNVEFYPGVLLLRQRGRVDFGLGAGMLFRRDDFLRKVDWREMGANLADDFFLGQKLGPVRISQFTLVTSADAPGWRTALLHYLRWSKTVWWNRPGSSALRILVLPILGWAFYVGFHPGRVSAWAGLILMMQVDAVCAGAICRRAGCRLSWRNVPTLEAWALGRALVWMACWLPWSVVWSGRRWRGPQMPLAQIDT